MGLLLVDGQGTEAVPPRRGRRARLQHLARIVDAYRRAIARVGDPSPTLADGLEDLPSIMSGDVEAVEPLLDLVQEGMPRGPKLLRSRGRASSPVLLAALHALSTFPDCPANVQKALAKAAKSGDPDVRAAALGLQEP